MNEVIDVIVSGVVGLLTALGPVIVLVKKSKNLNEIIDLKTQIKTLKKQLKESLSMQKENNDLLKKIERKQRGIRDEEE